MCKNRVPIDLHVSRLTMDIAAISEHKEDWISSLLKRK